MENLALSIDRLRGRRIAVIGDVVADQFLNGTISRISREAPVFILRHDETVTRPGGAANAAVNVASLGGVPLLVGIVGRDPNGEMLRAALRSGGVPDDHLVHSASAATTTKVRVLAGRHYAPRQQVIRIDYESSNELDDEIRAELEGKVRAACETADAVIFSDYNYGAATRGLFEIAREITASRGVPLIADSRSRLPEFAGATSATPNQEEAEQILGREFTPGDGEELRERLQLETLLVTCGNKGTVLVESGGEPLVMPAIGSKVPVDVTGAGDTVIAAYSLALASGLAPRLAASIANHAAGIVVMKRGTAAVSAEELSASLSGGDLAAGEAGA
ncbi:MAG: bifunctional heptose 7-phosphate kinase/heptose 1-phosphate adenyltransferase [Pyrinomonadaceae bacterium]